MTPSFKLHNNFLHILDLCTNSELIYSHGKNDFADVSKNLARFENNFVGKSK